MSLDDVILPVSIAFLAVLGGGWLGRPSALGLKRKAFEARVELVRAHAEKLARELQDDRPAKPKRYAPKPFEAYTECPACGAEGFHFLREPKPPTPVSERLEQVLAIDWDSPEERARYVPPVDESVFEVVRCCRSCGHEFGQV